MDVETIIMTRVVFEIVFRIFIHGAIHSQNHEGTDLSNCTFLHVTFWEKLEMVPVFLFLDY